MTQDSGIFDSIRISRGKKKQKVDKGRPCDWEGCAQTGAHPAPKGRSQEGEYHYFCLTHVREYNKQFNYFNGMEDDAVRNFQKDSITGLRPTWKMGPARGMRDGPTPGQRPVESELTRAQRKAGVVSGPASRQRMPGALERRALATLGVASTADAQEIKTRYKELVKIHHPDSNGGDRSSEERLRRVIQAYTLLKKSGFCG